MNISEAYDFLMKKVDELKEQGIEISFRDSIVTPDTIEKYNKLNRLPSTEWKTISLGIQREGDLGKVREIEHLCSMVGIYFDTGYGGGQREWEIDWSFRTS